MSAENRNPVLTFALRALADDDARAGASSAVEARLLTEVRSIASARRRRRRRAGLAVAAMLLTAIAVASWRNTLDAPVAVLVPPTPSTTARTEVLTAFFPLMHSSVPVTGGQVVRLEVPRAALRSFGLASIDAVEGMPESTLLADVLVGDDGLARAVRFVRPPIYEEKRK